MKAAMWNRSQWISETDPKKLRTDHEMALVAAGFKILDFTEHYFQPQGYSALWLLAESHFAIHTFPEENLSYIELSSCNEEYYNEFWKMLGHTKKLNRLT